MRHVSSYAVDTLNTGHLGLDTPASAVTTLVTATLLGYGTARAGAMGLNELRWVQVQHQWKLDWFCNISEMQFLPEWLSTVSGKLPRMYSDTCTTWILVLMDLLNN